VAAGSSPLETEWEAIMTPENRIRREHRHGEDDAPKSKDGKSQGIVRDQRGQEQPADKERAQRASKTKPAEPDH
jgi:hypothetical protein